MTTTSLLIGLTGRPMAGKDTAACFLRFSGWDAIAFADALRIEVAEAFHIPIEMLTDRLGKDQPARCLAAGCCRRPDWLHWCAANEHSLIEPRSPRWVMQRWGTDFRRAADDRHWARQVETWVQLKRAHNPGARLVVTDVRMPNEADMIRGLGGIVVRVHRPGDAPLDHDTAHHASEAHSQLEADADLHNDGSLQHFGEQVRRLAWDLAHPGWPHAEVCAP